VILVDQLFFPSFPFFFFPFLKKPKNKNIIGNLIVPEKNNGIKLELFVFDVFPFVNSMAVLECPREEEFSPLKNKAGPGVVDSAETSRHDILTENKKWVEAIGGHIEGDVEISPSVSYNGEGLESLKGVTLQGPKVIESLP